MKKDIRLDELLSRQDYLVVQANDLARAFGNLKAFEHKILDYCFSYVKENDNPNTEYSVEISDIITNYGLTDAGNNYKNIFKAFERLRQKTAFYYLEKDEKGVTTLYSDNLFGRVGITDNGNIKFKFSESAAPFVFNLKQKFYSFKLSELSVVSSKYTMIALKLFEARRFGNDKISEVKGSFDEFKLWFLGNEISEDKVKSKQWTASRFRQQVLEVAIEEINTKFHRQKATINVLKKGRTVVGYELRLIKL